MGTISGYSQNYLTYEYIIAEFKKLQEKHLAINAFFCGPLEEVDLDKIPNNQYPILYIEPSSININNYTQEFIFQVAVLDKFEMNETINQNDQKEYHPKTNYWATYSDMRNKTLNDCYLILKDITASFIQNFQTISWVNTQIDLELPINLTPVSTDYDNMLSGWTGTYSVTANNKNDLCQSMITPNS